MEESKKGLLKKLAIWFAPIFTIIMYSLPWCGLYNEQSFVGNNATDVYSIKMNYIELFKEDISLMSKIVLIASLVGVVSSIILYVLSVIIKKKEQLFTKIATIVLLVSTLILFLTPLFKTQVSNTHSRLDKWVSFMTLPYGFLMLYNIFILYFTFNKKKEVK